MAEISDLPAPGCAGRFNFRKQLSKTVNFSLCLRHLFQRIYDKNVFVVFWYIDCYCQK